MGPKRGWGPGTVNLGDPPMGCRKKKSDLEIIVVRDTVGGVN